MVSLGVGLAWRKDIGRGTVRLGGGARGGLAILAGLARDESVAAGSFLTDWIAPTVAVGAAFRPARRLSLDLGLEAGWSFSGISGRVAGQVAVDMGGPFVGASLGFSIVMGG